MASRMGWAEARLTWLHTLNAEVLETHTQKKKDKCLLLIFVRMKNLRLSEAELFLFLPLPHPIFFLSFLLFSIFHPFIPFDFVSSLFFYVEIQGICSVKLENISRTACAL